MTDKPQVGSIVFGPPSDAYEYRITKSDGPTALSNTAELFAENERLRASIRHRTDAVIARGIYANAYRDGLGVAETEITEWLQSEGHHELAKRIVAQEHRREDDDTRRIDRVAELEAENERLRDELQRANNFGAHMVEKYGEKGDW